jgi:hypothetical protein
VEASDATQPDGRAQVSAAEPPGPPPQHAVVHGRSKVALARNVILLRVPLYFIALNLVMHRPE